MTRVAPWTIALLSTIIVTLFAPVIVLMLAEGNDYPAHIRFALIWDETGYLLSPHFLYHRLFLLVRAALNNSALAASILAILCYLCLGWIVIVLLNRVLFGVRRGWIAAVAVTVILLLVTPINLLTLKEHNLYWGYISIHTYHNPTILLLNPLALVVFLFAVRIFDSHRASLKTVFVCGIVAALTIMAKPSYAICLLPALAILTAFSLLRKRAIDWGLLVGIALPTMIVLVWQYLYVDVYGRGGFTFAPFQVMRAYSPDGLLPKFLLSLLFPLCVLVSYFKQARTNLTIQLAWLAFALGAFYSYFMAETILWQDANFLWSGQISLLILFIISTHFWLAQNVTLLSARQISWKFGLCATVLALHVASGIAFYVSNLHADWRTWM
jgi:hypothetical protein